MKDFSLIKSLVGKSLRDEELKYVDCYVHSKLGLFIPSVGKCGYAQRKDHTHPTYMITILFSTEELDIKPSIEIKKNHYFSTILSPDIPHNDISEEFNYYYCILIDKDYFKQEYKRYTDENPYFEWKQFSMCSDILKTLNTFAFEYTKNMQNSDITLDAQATVITHWIIRSILGENQGMRSISSNYTVARAQHYIEQRFDENITVSQLAESGHMSVSNFNRIFKKEINLTPINYLNEIRIEKSKTLLRRKDIPITEIAAKCGFGSSAHFATNFKRLTNVTPSVYRDSYKS